jgi:class 3 adenylate cyclase
VDADNAVAAAVEMQQSLNDLNRTLADQLGHTVDMGISIHTGEVVAGNIGFEKKMDYTVIGDAVNTVFRLQGLAKAVPNGILISGNTLRAVRSRLKVRALPIPLDFEREFGPLKVYALQAADDRPAAAGSASVSSDSLQTPIRLGTP